MTDFLFDRRIKLVFTDRDDDTDQVIIENPEIVGEEPLKIDFQVEKQLSTEPNRADIDITNLSDDSASKINFRKPILEFKFGRKVEIFAGYGDRVKKIFSGVVIAAITSREGAIKVTRVECRNIFYELMQSRINETAAKGTLKSSFILRLLTLIGANIEAKARAVMIQRLSGQVFKDTTTFTGTAYNIINEINRGLLSAVTISFDDIATSFNPVGLALDEESVEYDATKGQILGTPQPTEIGTDFSIPLDPDLKISSPVLLKSATINAFFPSGEFVVKQIIHSGVNRADGVFESRVISVFNRAKQAQAATG